MTLDEVLEPFKGEAVPDWDAVKAALLVREDNMADILRLAGMQFGMYPWIVSEVLAQIGLGTPLTEEERQFIAGQYADGIAAIKEQQQIMFNQLGLPAPEFVDPMTTLQENPGTPETGEQA